VAIAVASAGNGQVRVGLVLDQPLVGRGSDPVNFGAYRGLVRAARHLHVQTKVAVPAPGQTNDLAPFEYLAAHDYNLVIAFFFQPGLSKAVRRFPHTKFAVLDSTRQQANIAAANVEGTVFHAEQAAYLAGFVAARMADRGPPPHVVSSVGGSPEPQVDAYIAGFRAGAKRADPKIKLLNAYTNDFVRPAACRNTALAQIAQGSRVVFDVAAHCGTGALNAAKRRGVYGIGVDIDQSYLGHYILTSVVKNLNVAVYDLAKRDVQDRLRAGGNLNFNLRNHGVGLGKFSPKVPMWLRRQLIPLEAQIEQGKIVVPATFTGSH
jgi:basic membrane protein A and related proteins